jgi:aspartate ammonia-lyase
VELVRAEPENCARLLNGSWAFAAAYVPLLGYEAVRKIIEENHDDPGKKWFN